jgi:hypothetical protein
VTAFTINAGGTVKWDSLSGGSTNGTFDSYVISNNTTLLIETDSMYCAGHSVAAGGLDTTTFSGLGGQLKIDGTNVRVIPFDTGTSTVPAIGTTISRSGVSGYLLGVWADWQSEPVAAGGAMPASGYIKIKDKTGGTFSAGALTGISASATGADVVGWIEVRGSDTQEIWPARLGVFERVGDWFYLDNTNGSRGQVIPCPTTGTNAGCFPGGVQIETSPGSGVYEWYRSIGTLAASSTIPTDATRGKIIWQTTSGIRIGSDGTNNVGYLPASGCKVRIGNVILTNCTRSGAGCGPRVVPNSSLGTRIELRPEGSGIVIASKCHTAWFEQIRGAYSMSYNDCGISDQLQIETPKGAPIVVGNCVATTQVQTSSSQCYWLVNLYGGGTFTDNVGLIQGNTQAVTITDAVGVTFARNHMTVVPDGQNAWTVSRAVDCTWTDEAVVGGRLYGNGCKRPVITNYAFAQHFKGVSTGLTGVGAVDFDGATSDGVIANIYFPVTNNHPTSWLCDFTQCTNMTLRLLGTYAAPLDGGSVNPMQKVIGRRFNWSDYGTKVQRAFLVNIGGLSGPDTNNYQYTMENVFGDFADTYNSLSPNSVAKGCGFAVLTSAFGGVSGVHWRDHFTSTTVGKIQLLMNEPTTATAAQFALTSGAALWDGNGHVKLITSGDQAVWEMAYFALGHTSFANVAPTLNGDSANHTFEFQYDIGAGYNGTWLTLNATNLSGVGAIDPAVGVRLKIRITCSSTNTNNIMTSVLIETVTTSSAQSTNLYPLATNTLTITGMISGTRYRVEKVSDGSLIGQGTSTGGPDLVVHTLAVSTSARIIMRKASAAPKYLPLEQLVTLGDFASAVTVSQQSDIVAI